jgi:hypothetical protein
VPQATHCAPLLVVRHASPGSQTRDAQQDCPTAPHAEAPPSARSHTPPTHALPAAQYPGPPRTPLSQPGGASAQHTCPTAPQVDPYDPGAAAPHPLVPDPELHPELDPELLHVLQEHPSHPPKLMARRMPSRTRSGAHRVRMP